MKVQYIKIDNTGKEIEVELRYQLGGINWGTGDTEARGYYVSFDVVERDEHFTRRELYGSMGTGYKTGKILCKEVKRKSQKVQTNIENSLDFVELGMTWFNKKYSDAFAAIQVAGELV